MRSRYDAPIHIPQLERKASDFLDRRAHQSMPVCLPDWQIDPKKIEFSINYDWREESPDVSQIPWLKDEEYIRDEIFYSSSMQRALGRGQNLLFTHCFLEPRVSFFADAYPRARITALDINPNIIEGNKRFQRANPRRNLVKFVTSPAETTPFRDNTFTGAATFESLYTNPYRTFQEYVRIIQSGGVFVGACKSDGGFEHDVIQFSLGYSQIYNAPYQYIHDKKNVLLIMQVTDEVKKQYALDGKMLDLIYGLLGYGNRNSGHEVKDFGREGFVHALDRQRFLSYASRLGNQQEIQKSLQRLLKVPRVGHTDDYYVYYPAVRTV